MEQGNGMPLRFRMELPAESGTEVEVNPATGMLRPRGATGLVQEPDVTDDGRWITTCSCGNVVRLKNLAFRHSSPNPCEHCLNRGADDIDDRSVASEAGWCGCGDPEQVDTLMLRYLAALPKWEHEEGDGLSDDVRLLLSYVADDIGWTEHGTSVYGCWLTDDGKEALSNLRELLSANPDPRRG